MAQAARMVLDDDGFRLRGTEVTRVEAFSDVVFGFALTLLVVSLEVPKTYRELHLALMAFVPFALCFLFLILIWTEHYTFFRRFGLNDRTTIRINSLLLFVVLFYVYPVKFLFTMLASLLLSPSGHARIFDTPRQLQELMVVYGVGFAALYGLLGMLNYQGWRRRDELALNAHERVMAKASVLNMVLTAGIGLLSCCVAMILPAHLSGLAGLAYLLIPLHKVVTGRRLIRQRRALRMRHHDPEAAE